MVGWMLLWGLVGLALLTVSIAGTVWLVGGARARVGPAGPGPAQAEEILLRRFAEGEIDEDELARKRATLGL